MHSSTHQTSPMLLPLSVRAVPSGNSVSSIGVRTGTVRRACSFILCTFARPPPPTGTVIIHHHPSNPQRIPSILFTIALCRLRPPYVSLVLALSRDACNRNAAWSEWEAGCQQSVCIERWVRKDALCRFESRQRVCSVVRPLRSVDVVVGSPV